MIDKADGAIKRREGYKLIHKIPEGWTAKLLPNGDCVIAHPDHLPRLLRSDGTSEELKPH